MARSRAFVWADLHLGHQRVCEFLDDEGRKIRPFATAEEMDEALVEANNAVVRPGDRVYIAGDVAISRHALPTLARMHGDKVLIKGNHDIHKLKDYLPYFDDIRAYVVLPKARVVISHIPVHPGSVERWVGNIHGHLHQRRVLLPDGQPDPRYLCVSVEHTGYAPLLLDEAIARLKAQQA